MNPLMIFPDPVIEEGSDDLCEALQQQEQLQLNNLIRDLGITLRCPWCSDKIFQQIEQP